MGVTVSRLREGLAQLNQSHAEFFNRQEMNMFLKLFSNRPKWVQLVLGPKGSGKSEFLKHLDRMWTGDRVLSRIAPILYVDCQIGNVKTCADAAHVLILSIIKFKDKLAEAAVSSPFTVAVPPTASGVRVQVKPGDLMEAMFDDSSYHTDMLTMLERVLHVIQYNQEEACPILIFDEIADFKYWEEVELSCFGHMLRAIVAMSGAFVIISTSDSFFMDWLEKALPYHDHNHYLRFGIGFLTPEDARKYMFDFVIPKFNAPSLPPLEDTQWMQVFRACGGMPPLLSQCAEAAVELQSWEKAVEQVVLEAMYELRDVWGSRYFRKLCELLVVRGGFVELSDVEDQVFDGARTVCKQELSVLIKANVIYIRWSVVNNAFTDFTPPVPSKDLEYVTFSTPAIMAAVKLKMGAELLCRLSTCSLTL